MNVYYSDQYTAAAESFDTTRKSSLVAATMRSRPIKDTNLVSPASATFEELCLVHDPYYVESVMTGYEPLAGSSGLSWDEGVWEMTAAMTGGIIAAAKEAMNTKGISGSLSSGFHHAKPDRGEGFCIFNGLGLVAIKYALKGAKVLIIDLDAHCGGGTHEIIKGNKNIYQLDISTDGYDDYMPTEEQTLIVLHRAKNYLEYLEQELEKHSGFDLMLYNAGMDPHGYCPLGGLKGITKSTLRKREKMVFDWARANRMPSAFVLAGGYVGPRLREKELVELHRLTVEAASRK